MAAFGGSDLASIPVKKRDLRDELRRDAERDAEREKKEKTNFRHKTR